MAQQEDQLRLHLSFSELSDGKALDLTGNGNFGELHGDPEIVHDPYFGAVLRLSGSGEQWVSVRNGPTVQIQGDQTIEMWLKPSVLGARRNPIAKAYGGEGTITLETNGRLSYYYGQAGTNAQPYQGFHSPSVVVVDEWVHIAIVRDLQAKKLTWYANGEEVQQAEATYVPAEESNNELTIGRGYVSPFAGDIAHVRLYARALTREEIQRDIDDDRTAVAAFRMTHPVGFCLCDQDEQNVLYILDKTVEASYRFEVSNDTRRDILFKDNGDEGLPTATVENSYFELVFRPGTLVESSLDKLTVAEPGWTVSHRRRESGAIGVLFRSSAQLHLGPGATHALTLQNVQIESGAGSRGSRVELRYRGLYIDDADTPVEGNRLQHLSIINERGRRQIPLHVGIVGSDKVLNDGHTPSSIQVRLTNTMKLDPAYPDRSTIFFNPANHAAPSKFVLSFDTQGDGETSEWALATAAQAHAFHVSRGNTPIDAEGDVAESPEWVIPPEATALAAGQHIDIQVTGIVTGHQNGRAKLYLRHKNVPGYRDGTLELTLEKSPLLFINQHVGVGAVSTSSKLNVDGNLSVTGAIRPSAGSTEGRGILFPKDPGGGAGDAAWIRYYARSGEATTLEIGTSDNTEDHIAFMSSGGVGIGTTTPGAKLHVKGGSRFEGGRHFFTDGENKGRVRVGAAWGIPGLYSEDGEDLVLGVPNNKKVFIGHSGQFMTVVGDGRVGLGTTTPAARLDVLGEIRASAPIRSDSFRPSTNDWEIARNGENLEIREPEDSNKVWMRIADDDGLHLLGAPNLYASGKVKAGSLQIGNTTIGAHELAILKKLASGTLTVDLLNTAHNEYLYAAGDWARYDKDRRRVFTWMPGGRVTQGFWRIASPR